MSDNLMEEYDGRLQNLPQIDENIEQQIRKYEEVVEDQRNQLNMQGVRIKAMESEIIKYDKQLEQTENYIQELNSSEEKNAAKEKKYLMQIENYNKKIDSGKAEISKLQKSITLLKKDIKGVESNITSAKSDKNKIQQLLTKEQIKINNYTQTLNDLKLKIMEQTNKTQTSEGDTQKDERQIQELFNAIKKQMALIDILKRQKVHIVASTVFKYCEEEFEQVLEMNGQK